MGLEPLRDKTGHKIKLLKGLTASAFFQGGYGLKPSLPLGTRALSAGREN